jgi:hypothetical protein
VKPRVEEKKVTGFSDTEEEAVSVTKVVPFLLEHGVEAEGRKVLQGADWGLGVGRSAQYERRSKALVRMV